MSFLGKIQDANQGLVSTKSEVYLISKPKSTDNLKTILNWVKVEGERLSKDLQSFKDHIELLLSENMEFYKWIISNTQQKISLECGISQSYASRIFGPIQKEHKERIKEQIVQRVESGDSYKQIALDYDCSEKSVQRVIQQRGQTKYHSNNLSDDQASSRKKSLLVGRSSDELVNIIIEQEDLIESLKSTIREQEDIIRSLRNKN